MPLSLPRATARTGLVALLLTSLLSLGALVPSAGGTTPDVGYFGPTYSGLETTGAKPESKLWFHDGSWWAVMRDETKTANRIWRLDREAHEWRDTGVVVDSRSNTHADVLWDGTTLAVASHVYSTSNSTGNPARLFTFAYDAGRRTWARTTAQNGTINDVKSEALVIARDSTRRLWATWVQGGKVFVNHSTTDDVTWTTPKQLAAGSTDANSDDISSIIAFGGNRIGIMWSNQKAATFQFAIHEDGAGDDAWKTETAASGPLMADDHVNLKTDAGGRVYAAVKTSRSKATDVLIALLVRSAGGVWSFKPVSLVRESNTRPIVLVDEEHGTVRVVMTGPQPPSTNGQSGGDIVVKEASLDDLAFGDATPLIHREANPNFSDATSTKQNLSTATRLVVLASENYAKLYGTAIIDLGAPPPPPPPEPAPVAAFTGSPTSGAAPLTTTFMDTSTGGPISWSWDFGDGATSTERNPQHVYATPGTYSVSLTVANASGSSTADKPGFVTVTAPPPPPPGETTATFVPVADSYVSSSSPASNAGSSSYLRVQATSATYRSYVQFDVANTTGTVSSAKLRFYATASAASGGSVYVAPNSWSEKTITWSNAPAPTGAALGSIGATATGAWYEVDVTSAVTGNGTSTFVLSDGGTTSAWFNAREGANPPQLVVTFG